MQQTGVNNFTKLKNKNRHSEKEKEEVFNFRFSQELRLTELFHRNHSFYRRIFIPVCGYPAADIHSRQNLYSSSSILCKCHTRKYCFTSSFHLITLCLVKVESSSGCSTASLCSHIHEKYLLKGNMKIFQTLVSLHNYSS